MVKPITRASLWLEPVPEALRDSACAALDEGNLSRFFNTASNEASLGLVLRNFRTLMERGLYEEALLHSFIYTRTNNLRWPEHVLRGMFALADREKLRTAGEALPGPGPFTVYRGVAGTGEARRILGISWTASKERARWFSRRDNLPDPDVFCTEVEEADVLAYTNKRKEEEFFVLLPNDDKVIRLPRVDGPILKTPEGSRNA